MTPLAFLKALLIGALAVLALSLALSTWMVGTEVSSTLQHVSKAADSYAAAPALLATTISGLPKQILPPLLARVDTATGKLDAQLTGARGDIASGIASGTQSVTQSVAALVMPIEGLRADLKPVLANTAALIADGQAALDDSYWDAKALLESATVATTQTAQTMESVRAIAPQFLESTQRSNREFAGVATDVHAFTSKFVAPSTKKHKVWEGFKSLVLIGGRII